MELIRLLRRRRIPTPCVEYRVVDRGKLVGTLDLAYPDIKLAIEADGYDFHSKRDDWEHDRIRRNALTALGWLVLHVTWRGLRSNPDRIVADVRRARHQRASLRTE